MDKNIFVSYIKLHLRGFVTFIAFASIFFTTFYLYHLPLEPVVYATAICGVLGIIILSLDMLSYRKKHLILNDIKNRVTLSIEQLPRPNGIIEQDYEDLISILFEEKGKLTLRADMNRVEMLDYYTLWVHQVKTPIAALRILLQTSESENKMELLNEVFKIEQYVEMVLGYLRLESLSSDLIIKKYSLDDVVRQVVRKYASLFIGKKIKLNFSSLNTQVLTDEKWIVFVIEQLISNAIKYTHEGGTISIYMDYNLPNTLVLEDSGIGIAPEDLPRVFERGFTGFNGRNDKKSTGLGLYLCKNVLSKLSHTIFIESEVAVGTKTKLKFDTVKIAED